MALLTATYQWGEWRAFSGNATKRVSAKPKGYLADTGLACSSQMISSPAFEALSDHAFAMPWDACMRTGDAREA